jgi:hypothetical protein
LLKACHVLDEASYRLPLARPLPEESVPPQTIMLSPVQTAVWYFLPNGAPESEVACHELLVGSYRPPVPNAALRLWSVPPHTIISLPAHTAVWFARGNGASSVAVVSHASATGSYSPPVFRTFERPEPPHTIMRLPVHTAECRVRDDGALEVDVGSQVSDRGL